MQPGQPKSNTGIIVAGVLGVLAAGGVAAAAAVGGGGKKPARLSGVRRPGAVKKPCGCGR